MGLVTRRRLWLEVLNKHGALEGGETAFDLFEERWVLRPEGGDGAEIGCDGHVRDEPVEVGAL